MFDILSFDVDWFTNLTIVASNDINEDTIHSLNHQVSLKWSLLLLDSQCCRRFTVEYSYILRFCFSVGVYKNFSRRAYNDVIFGVGFDFALKTSACFFLRESLIASFVYFLTIGYLLCITSLC